jgi:proteasome lid subunit RPN8/RPN11
MTRAQRDAIVAHAERDAPKECAGYLSLRDGVVEEVFEAKNEYGSPKYGYVLGAPALMALAELEDEGLGAGVYHSHPRSPAVPSQTDVNLVNPLNAHYAYLIVSLENGGGDSADLRAWRIDGEGEVSEEEIVYDG